MKLLLTGAAGFIGSHLAARRLDRGDHVVGLDVFDETLYPAALHARNLATVAERPGFEFVRGDLMEAPLLRRLFDEHGFDLVLHFGALAGVRPSLLQPDRYLRVNIEGTLNLLEVCRRRGVSRFVFASSSSVYGGHSRAPFSEDDAAVRPASPYAASKRAAELYCSTYSDLYGIATTCLRFFTVYGPRQRPEMAIHSFADRIADGRSVPVFGDGLSARDYTYIDDVLDGIDAAIERTGDAAHRIYNLGGARATKLLELIALLESCLGRKAVIEHRPLEPGDVALTCADLSHASRELGYQPRVTLEDGLARFCAWFSSARATARS